MTEHFDSTANYDQTRQRIGYVERKKATPAVYENLGFKCGVEIHQQLKTQKKLFCRCPAGIYQKEGEYDAELIRHMRPTLSELGEYDGTALMEFKTKKNIIYHIANVTTCTYDIDDTPPFAVNRQAIDIAIEVALLAKMNIVGELHITRKQYLDGSIPTGFQRTGIIGIEGKIPLGDKTIRLIQLSVEEDSCREVSDVGHFRTYTTDRLGMPLIETVTYPDMKTPDEAAEATHYLRFLARSTGKVRTGIGAARQDVNVSVTGGTRVEIKGVAHIAWIPALTHNEAFRQKALLEIKSDLTGRVPAPADWKISHVELNHDLWETGYAPLKRAKADDHKVIAVNLPEFKGLLSFFTQPGKMFADEIGERLKVIACLERPNMLHSEQLDPVLSAKEWTRIKSQLNAGKNDAQIVLWTPAADLKTALDTIEERCRLVFHGVPNETRKSFPDGTTIFERVLPGPDRMYPDTDSAPIPIPEALIAQKKKELPPEVHEQLQQLQQWQVPSDTYHYILKNNLMPTIRSIVTECKQKPSFVGSVFGHTLKNIEGRLVPSSDFSYRRVYDLFKYVTENGLESAIIREMLPIVYEHPNMLFDSVLTSLDYKKNGKEKLLSYIPMLKEKFEKIKTSRASDASVHWIMGQMRGRALGNIPLKELRTTIEKEI